MSCLVSLGRSDSSSSRCAILLILLVIQCCVQQHQVCAFSTNVATTPTTAPPAPPPVTKTKKQKKYIQAQDFATFQLAKLKEAGLMGEQAMKQRPYTIVAEAIGTSAAKSMRTTDQDDDPNCLATKIIHFQRHGQGYHNLIGEMYREFLGRAVDLDDKDPSTNPFIREEMLDSPLTEKGRLECVARRPQAALLNPQAVIVSSLNRAIHTSLLSFADHTNRGIPWIAHEGAREQLGLLMCNKRRSLKETQFEFPMVDFSAALEQSGGEDDTWWQPAARESPAEETERIYHFLTDFVLQRPESELAVVGHSAWLFTMCNAVVDCGTDDELRSLFQTSEIRSMRLSFYKTTRTRTNSVGEPQE